MAKRNQTGETVIIVLFVLLFALIAAQIGVQIYISSKKHEHTERFDRWTAQCIAVPGEARLVSSNRYECFVDGKQVTLPGWENY